VLNQLCEFVPATDSEFFSAAPAGPAVFLLRGHDPQSQPYVGKTANLRRRLLRLLGPPTHPSRKLNLRERVRWIEYSPTGSDFESGFLLYQVLRSQFPDTYSDRMRFRFAPLVKLHLENQYPRASITTRLGHLFRALRRKSSPTIRSISSRCAAAWMICIPIRRFPDAFIQK